MASGTRRSTEVLAVELGERTIKVIQGPSRKKSVIASRVLLIDTPQGSVEQFVVTDWEKLKNAFKHEIFTRTKSRKIMFIMDHPDVIKRRLTLNVVDDSDLPGLVRYRLGEYLGFDMDAYIVQFTKIEESQDARGMPILDVFVSAIPKYIVESYVGLCEELGLEPYVLDTKTNVLQSIMTQGITVNGNIRLADERIVCFVEMGQEQMEVNIYEDGFFRYNHIVPEGVLTIFERLAVQYGMEASEIERFILSHSLDHLGREELADPVLAGSAGALKADPKESAAVMRSYQEELATWIDGVYRVLLLYGGRQDRINQILAYGDGIDYPGIEDMLLQRVSSEVKVIESMSSLNTSKKNDRLGSGLYRYVNLVGLISK